MAPRPALPARLRGFGRSRSGLAAIELAIACPLLALLLLGGFDVARYVLSVNKVMKIGFAVSDVAAQYETLNDKTMKQIFLISSEGMPDYVSGATGVTILTSVYADASGAPKISWQCFSSNGSTWTSKVGAVPGGAAAVDKALFLDDKDNIIVSEVYYKFNPVFRQFFKNGFDIYSTALFRPRLGTLKTKPCS